MSLLIAEQLLYTLGERVLLDRVNFSINPGDRVALLGRNGCGKSTLLKIIQGSVKADDGRLKHDPSLRVAALQQDVPQGDSRTVYQLVLDGLGDVARSLQRYHQLTEAVSHDPSSANLDAMARCQSELEALDAWQLHSRIESIVSQLQLPAEQTVDTLSGGWRRRVLLAQALVQQPDILLLDEPTNHLDIDSIEWIENFLIGQKVTLLFVTHDRAFLKKLATRIFEIDRGHLQDYPGDYDTYLQRKAEFLAAEEQSNKLFDKKLAEEEVWIRQGIKARRTRNEGRVRALKALREQRKQRREQQATAKLSFANAGTSSKLVFETTDVSYSWEHKTLISHLDLIVQRGDKLALIGPNGSGKSSLIKLLLGDVVPDSGVVRRGDNLSIAYFDQHRHQLNPKLSIVDNVAEGRSSIEVNGKSKHVMSYLSDFLFQPSEVQTPVERLSGGERNRVMLAKLFTKPANVLILDEPTNDLDLETLEILEQRLLEFNGTLLLVSHDRDFVDNVATSVLAFEAGGKLTEYVGGYSDYLNYRDQYQAQQPGEIVSGKPGNPVIPATTTEKIPRKKLSYKEQRELDELPVRIEQLERQIQALTEQTGAEDFYKQEQKLITETMTQLQSLNEELELAFERWQELDS